MQVVRSVVSSGKFYQLLPDKEKTVLWILKILLTKIYLRSMISFLLFSNQVYKAALLLLFMGVPLLRCWERWLWFSPVHSTTSRCGILCCCMYILITFAACHGSILAKKQKQLMKKQTQLNWYFWSHPYHTDRTIMGSLLFGSSDPLSPSWNDGAIFSYSWQSLCKFSSCNSFIFSCA